MDHRFIRRTLRAAVPSLLLTAGMATAATITVDNASEGSVAGRCTLRDAVAAANTNAALAGCAAGAVGMDTIEFAPDVVEVILSDGELTVSEDLAFDGGDAMVAIRRDQAAAPFRVIDAFRAENLTLDHLIVSGGRTDATASAAGYGGGILANALKLADSIVRDNTTTAANAHGGGIAAASLEMLRSRIEQNSTAGESAQGGGLFLDLFTRRAAPAAGAQTYLTLTDSFIIGNRTEGDQAHGGGAFSRSVTAMRSTVQGNRTSGRFANGGGLLVAESLVLTDSLLDDNHVEGDESVGGGAAVILRAELLRSRVSRNTTAGIYGVGGGLLAGAAVITDSLIDANATQGEFANGGGVYTEGAENRLASPDGVGDGLTLTLVNSTISGNRSGSESDGAGAWVYARALIDNSTISGNIGGFDADGGGLFLTGPITLRSSLVYGNYGSGGTTDPWDIAASESLTLEGDHNLVGVAAGETQAATITLPADTLDCDPLLQPLADNGGPTWTQALAEGSCAIDAGSNAAALAFDQRGEGFPRVGAAAPDIGAFERQPAAPPTASITLSKTITGAPPGGVTASFDYRADCGAAGIFTGRIDLTAASEGNAAIADVPVGANCTVGETSRPSPPPGYAWSTPPFPVTLTVAAATNLAAFPDTLRVVSPGVAEAKPVPTLGGWALLGAYALLTFLAWRALPPRRP